MEYLAARMTERRLAPLETLFWVGDSSSEMFIVQEGRVEVCIPDMSGREIRLAVLGPGDFLGEISLLDGGTRSATARALDNVVLVALGRRDFHACLLDFPTLAVGIINILSRRQRNTVEKLRGIRNVNEVLAETLTPWQQLAHTIARLAASPAFMMVHSICLGSLISINLVMGGRAIDPYPFPFLCFWASVEAIFLSMFILISQAMQGQKDRMRSEIEYQIALKLQLELMQVHQKLDEQSTLLRGRGMDSFGAVRKIDVPLVGEGAKSM